MRFLLRGSRMCLWRILPVGYRGLTLSRRERFEVKRLISPDPLEFGASRGRVS